MIRKATLDDTGWIVNGLRDMFDLLGNPELYDPVHLYTTFVPYIISNGIALVDSERQGVIGGIITPHLYCPSKIVLSEMVWWVASEKRGSSMGYKLLKSFEDAGYQAGVDLLQMSLMETSTVSSLEKRGYKRKEYALVKEMK